MKLYRVHLPHHHSPEHHRAHHYMRDRLGDIFGGYTSWQGEGFWREPNGETYREAVTIYEVASAREVKPAHTFRAIALAAGAMIKEKAVYVIIDGVAEIIDL